MDKNNQKSTEEKETCPDCDTVLVEHSETRGEVGFFEIVVECPGCGNTWTN